MLDDIRRKTAHRVPEEPTSDRLRESEKQRTFHSEDAAIAFRDYG